MSDPDADAALRESDPLRNAYFGDLHVHTRYSLDAFFFGAVQTPDAAYRFARGEPITHALGYEMQLASPLDFYAVTDHAGLIGHVLAFTDPERAAYASEIGEQIRQADTPAERLAVMRMLPQYAVGERWRRELFDAEVLQTAWQEIIDAAERHYQPGAFTTFVGYEYSSAPDSQNLHRNVIFRGGSGDAIPFSLLDSPNPEDLWRHLDELRSAGIDTLAIPHNSNESNGLMFSRTSFTGEPLDAAYAELRMRNEPIVEMVQIKGTSETHPLLSPNDEWAGHELYPYRSNVAFSPARPSAAPGSYVRDAYLRGLQMQQEEGCNPYRFGMIGSSDTHNAASTPEESSYPGKIAAIDGSPERRGSVPPSDPEIDSEIVARYAKWSAAGLAGVWAEENSREAIFDALRRKETFATSGPRIRVRFFAGHVLPDRLGSDDDLARAYRDGVPMGGDLRALKGRTPRFLARALRDPNSAPLARLQIVKGWLAGGVPREQVFDVDCSEGAAPDATSHRCPDNGATVDVSDCSYEEDRGAGELEAAWTDPGFDPTQRAFYYVRVLENPTCRWSTWDAVGAGVVPNPELAATIQERAWSSPIWYLP